LDCCNKAQWRWHWRSVNVFSKINLFLKRKRTVCRTFEMTHVVFSIQTCYLKMAWYICFRPKHVAVPVYLK
jgi:hypothetical protein